MREPMVTRTITTTKVTVLCVNVAEQHTFDTEVVLPRTYKNVAEMLKTAEKIINTDDVKAVSIKSYELEETLYGMTEADFINSDKIKLLPKRTKKDETKAE
mgnify:CR=1 FL=1